MKNSNRIRKPKLAYSPGTVIDDDYNPNKKSSKRASLNKLFSFNTSFNCNNNGSNLATDSANEKINQNSCLLEHSPFYIHKIAQTDRLNEFKLALGNNKSGLELKDKIKGWCPIHYAVSKDSILILEYILDNSEDIINIQEKLGNTPLHIAIESNSPACLSLLLTRGADCTLKNNQVLTPLHYCITLNRPDLLDKLLSHPRQVDPDLTSEMGQTGLHYCAKTDNVECARVLMKHGAKFCQPCDNGFFPVSLASQTHATRVLQYLLSEGQKFGCSKLSMLAYVDSDNNKPLHTAVQFGNVYAVQVCLEYGASIAEVNVANRDTAVHTACCQGSLEILRLMQHKQPEVFAELMSADNTLEQKPIHKAAMFDHLETVKFLLEQGSSIDPIDAEGRTPLLLSASRHCYSVLCYLIQHGSDIKQRDACLRNFIHLAIIQEFPKTFEPIDCPIAKISEELCKRDNYQELLDEQDMDGCSIVHYSSKFGHVEFLGAFLLLGADVSLRCNGKRSPLHYAALNGHVAVCAKLLGVVNFKNFINERDVSGFTALHLACMNGHASVVQMLMEKGAMLYNSFQHGYNPFHLAAMKGSVSCLQILNSIEPKIHNSFTKDGDTPLHLAASHGHPETLRYLLDKRTILHFNKQRQSFIDLAIRHKHHCAIMSIIWHDRWQQVFSLASAEYKTPFIGITQLSTRLSHALMDRCISKRRLVSDPKNYSIQYNFKFLNWTEQTVNPNDKTTYNPMVPLLTMVEQGLSDCLSHKLCEVLLQRKWISYGLPIFAVTTSFYFLFLTMLTLTVVTCYSPPATTNTVASDLRPENASATKSQVYTDTYALLKSHHIYQVMGTYCIVYSIMQFLFEVVTLRRSEGVSKLFELNIQCSLILYPITIVFAVPLALGQDEQLNWQIGSVVIFVAWFNFLIYMRLFDFFGIYVTMFIDILKTLFKVIFLFSVLIVAFGLVFFILLRDHNSMRFKVIELPQISILRTVLMMVGEIDGLNSFILPFLNDSMAFGSTTLMFLLLFIVLVPILLTNLLIGLAVGDIDSIQKNAKLKRIAMQIYLYIDLERRIPRNLLTKCDQMRYTYTHGRVKCSVFKDFCRALLSCTSLSTMFGFKSKSESKNYLSLGADDETQSDEPYIEFEDTDTKLLHLKVAVEKQSELLTKLMLNIEKRC